MTENKLTLLAMTKLFIIEYKNSPGPPKGKQLKEDWMLTIHSVRKINCSKTVKCLDSKNCDY